MNKATPHTEARRRLGDLIKDIRFAMFTTRHDDGRLYSRPMTTQGSVDDDERCLWFFASRSSERRWPTSRATPP